MPECFALKGSTCNAIKGARKCTAMSPVDTAPALIALGAELEVKGPKETKMPLDSFFLSSGITVLGRNEIITSIIIPDLPLQKGSAYLKFSRRKTVDYAITSVGVRLVLRPDTDHCLEAKVALGGMGPIPLRASKAEEILNEERMTPAVFSKAAELASQAGHPWTDIHASNYYRRHLVRVMVRKALSVAVTRARAAE
jgi:carbon-monoxide dehydrogenase medium subunit